MPFLMDTGGGTSDAQSALDRLTKTIQTGQGASAANPYLTTGKSSALTVYMGWKPARSVVDTSKDSLFVGKTRKGEANVISLDEAIGTWYTWTEGERQAFARQVYMQGMTTDPADYESAFSIWQKAVTEAARYRQFAKKNVTPQPALSIMANLSVDKNAGFPKTQRSTQTSTNLPSKTEVQSVVKQIFQEKLGRDPTEEELTSYSANLFSAARTNPEKTQTTTTVDAEGNSSSTSTTSGGVDLGAVATTSAENDPEYASYLAGTTLYNAAMQLFS
jgi:hypothetical protein